MNIPIEKITVVSRVGFADLILLYTSLPSPLVEGEALILRLHVHRDTGADYARTVLGCEPEIIVIEG